MDSKTIIIIAIAAFLVLMNIISFSMMAIDKKRAQKDKTHSHPETRIPEKRLFLFTGLFGGVGGVLGMYLLHHKTKHWYFALFFPLMMVAQIAILVFLYCRFFK